MGLVQTAFPGFPQEDKFGKRLDQVLIHTGLSRKELAGRLSVDRSLIGKWIRDERVPSLDNLKGLIKLLVVELGTLSQHEAVDWVRSVREEVSWNTVTEWCEGEVRLGLPPELGYWIMRPSYVQLRQQMLASGSEADSVQAVVGPAGIGKTALLKALVHDAAVQQHYDRIIQIEVGPQRPFREILHMLALQVGQSPSSEIDTQAWLFQLKPLLSRQRTLMLVDDVWDLELMQVRQLASDRCRVLLATRQEDLLGVQQARRARIEVQPMNTQEGVTLFRRYLGQDWSEEMQESAAEAVHLLGGVPQALVLVAAQVMVDGWEQWISWLTPAQQRLKRLRLPGDASRDTSLVASLSLSFEALDEDHRQVLAAACQHPNPIPVDKVADDLGVDETTIYYRFKLLALRHLVDISGGVIHLPPLVRDFGRTKGS